MARSTAAALRRRRGAAARAAALLAVVLAAGAAGALAVLPPGSLPNKDCEKLAESACVASDTCFFNKGAGKCGPFVLPCNQYESKDACKLHKGCKGVTVAHCLPEGSAPAKPAADPTCDGQRKRKCKKNSTCNWNVSKRFAFGKSAGCTDEMPNGCEPLQTKKMCRGDPSCKREKVFHCVSKKPIPAGCDCKKEGSICDECYSL